MVVVVINAVRIFPQVYLRIYIMSIKPNPNAVKNSKNSKTGKCKRRNMYMLNKNDVVPFAWRGLADREHDSGGQGMRGSSGQRDGYHR